MEEGGVEIASVGAKATSISLKDEEQISVPSTEAKGKSRVGVNVVKEGKKRFAGYFVIKEFGSRESVEAFLQHHRFLKENGFVVPATAREIKGKNQVIVTDLSEKGEKRVVSINEIAHDAVDRNESIPNLQEIRVELRKIAEKADKLAIIIPSDAYFLVLGKKTNEAKLVIGDLGGIQITEEEKKEDIGYKDSFEPAKGFYTLIATSFSGGKYFPDTSF